MNADRLPPGDRVSVGQIAGIAGVRPSAVSNWRTRHPDFPLPVEQSPGGDLFELDAVLSWLERKEKPYHLPTQQWDRALWSAVDALRGEARIEEAVLLVMQLLYLRYQSERADGTAYLLEAELWRHLETSHGQAIAKWVDFVQRISDVAPDEARALSPQTRVGDSAVASAVHQVSAIPSRGVDWGAAATGLLYRLSEAGGVRGELSTPHSVTTLQVALLEPVRGTVYDPASGAAMVLTEAWRRRASDDVKLVGQDVSEYNWRLGYLHLALNGARFDLDTGDTLQDDHFRTLRAERVAADPPFGQKPGFLDVLSDERWHFGIPGGSADWLWAQQVIYHLAEGGVATMTIPPGALFRGGSEAAIRRSVVEADLLDAVIDLPPGLFSGTSIPAALLLFARDRANRRGSVLFVDARQLGQPRRGKPHELREPDIQRVKDVVGSWRAGKFEEVPRFAAAASTAEILASGVDLSPRRFVRYATRVTEIDGEPIPDRLNRLSERASELVPEAAAVAAEIVRGVEAFTESDAADLSLVRLGDVLVAEPRTGTRQDVEGDQPSRPFIPTGAVSAGSGRLTTVPDEVTRGSVRDRTVERGDVLLASRGISAESRIGCAVVEFDGEAAYSESLLRLRPDGRRLDPDYLRLFLTSRQGRTALAAATTGSVIANLRGDAVQEIEIRLPDLSTQRVIVNATRGFENGLVEIEHLLETCRDAFDTLREGVVAGLYEPATEALEGNA